MRAQSAIVDAVILAAGNGSRLNLPDGEPKPLANVGGVTLLSRIARAVSRAGVTTIHIVTGHRADRLRSGAFIEPPSCDVRWVHNPRFEEPNGLSLLAAETAVSGRFLLLMADHLFEQETLNGFLTAGRESEADVMLAVDFKLDTVPDLDDATKVMTVDSRLLTIGKSVRPFNAIDTGMFIFNGAVFPALRSAVAGGDSSLSAGVATLALDGGVQTFDIAQGRWIDVDTPAALRTAERMLDAGELS